MSEIENVDKNEKKLQLSETLQKVLRIITKHWNKEFPNSYCDIKTEKRWEENETVLRLTTNGWGIDFYAIKPNVIQIMDSTNGVVFKEYRFGEFWKKYGENIWILRDSGLLLIIPPSEKTFAQFIDHNHLSNWLLSFRPDKEAENKNEKPSFDIRFSLYKSDSFRGDFTYYFENRDDAWYFVKQKKEEKRELLLMGPETTKDPNKRFQTLLTKTKKIRELELYHLNHLASVALKYEMDVTIPFGLNPLFISNGVEKLSILIAHCELGGNSRLIVREHNEAFVEKEFILSPNRSEEVYEFPKDFFHTYRSFFKVVRLQSRLKKA